MKTIYASLIGMMSLLSNGYAQTDLSSKAILDKVSNTYQEYTTIQAGFGFTAESPQQESSSASGTLVLENGSGKYKVVLGEQEFISDGKIQWTIMKDQDEVQINTVDNSNSTLNPTNIFSFYKDGYKSAFIGTVKVDNKTLNAIELVPIDTKQNVFKIKMRIDKPSNLIYDATVFDKSGAKYTYTIHRMTVNQDVPATTFTFNKSRYPGMEIVDLR